MNLLAKYFPKIFNYEKDLICLIGLDWHFKSLSYKWSELLGYSIDELKNIPIASLIHPDDIESSIAASCDKDTHVHNYVNRYIKKDGSHAWLKWRVTQVEDDLFSAHAEDITLQKIASINLQASHQRFEDMVSMINATIFEIDKNYNIIYISSKVKTNAGYEVSDLINKPIYFCIAADDHQKVKEALERCIKLESPDFSLQLKVIQKDGQLRHRRIFGKPTFDNSNNLTGFLGTSIDIHNEVIAQEQFEKQRILQIQSNRLSSLGEMAGGIAHEINNPLSIINGHVSLIEIEAAKDKPNTKLINDQVTKLYDIVDRIAKIVRGMKNLSRQDDSVKSEEVLVVDIIEEITSMSHEKLQNIGVKSKINIGVYESMIRCRQYEIGQVLINLINNAVDGTENLQNRKIEINSLERDHFVIIQVLDNGAKIPAEVQFKMYDPFFTTKAIGKGTGLGLSISKTIVEKNHGTLSYLEYPEFKGFEMIFPKVLS